MRSMIVGILFAAMLALVGIPACADPVSGALGLQEKTEEKKPSLGLIYKRAYTGKRWIGVVRKGRSGCPEVDGWQVEKLADQAKRKADKRVAEERRVPEAQTSSSYGLGRESEFPRFPKVPVKARPSSDALLEKLGLDRICIYTPKEDPPVEFVPPDGFKVRQDRLAVATTSAGGLPSDPLAIRIWERLAALTTAHTGQVVLETGSPSVEKTLRFTGQPGVRLTFLDTQPDSQSPGGAFARPTAGGSLHGFTLVHLAQKIVCPPGPGASRTCAATIESRRALGDGQNGHVGLVSELATAIVAEVLDWREREPHKHLVLNLSLGWDGEGFGDLDARSVRKLEPSVQAVYQAIRFARQSGALVIAAAGNRKGGSKTEWPLLPAAWELRRPCWFPLPLGRKPVYAVGGVDWQDLPLSNSRDGGRPRRAAYADHSVTDSEALLGPTAMYTGTSVSATVTSSIAAVIWHLRPDLGPSQVMKLLARSGDPLPFRADFYAWKDLWPLSKLMAPPRAAKLSLCKAVERACGTQGSTCGGRVEPFGSCPEVDPSQGPGVGPLNEFTVIAERATVTEPTPEKSLEIQSQRWVYPQPEATPCPGCTVVAKDPPTFGQTIENSTEYELVYAIGTEWQDEASKDNLVLKSGLLQVKCEDDSYPPQDLPASALDPLPATAIKISLTDVGKKLTSCSAKITFEVTKGITSDLIPVDNPVLVDPKPTS